MEFSGIIPNANERHARSRYQKLVPENRYQFLVRMSVA